MDNGIRFKESFVRKRELFGTKQGTNWEKNERLLLIAL